MARRRNILFRLAAVTLVPLAFLLTVELGLRLVGWGYPTGFLVPARSAVGSSALTTNRKFGWRFFPPKVARAPVVSRIDRHKLPGKYRIFVLGGSAAMGTPDPAFGFSRILQVMLEERFPANDFEVVNAAMTAINSWVAVEIAGDVVSRGDPDMILVYLGNNEVVGPFGPGTTFGTFSSSRPWIRLSMMVRDTRLGQLMDRVAVGFGRDAGDSQWRGMEMFLERQVAADDPRLQTVYDHFRKNLGDIAEIAADKEVPVVLSTVAVNLKDSPPFASIERQGLTDEQSAHWARLVERGQNEAREGLLDEAVATFEEALAIDDGHAGLHFRVGRTHFAAKRFEAARRHFVLARDLDALRFRADSRINETIREVASGSDTIHLLDAELALERSLLTADHIPGNDLFYEHVHFNIDGNYRLAIAFFEAVRDNLPESIRVTAESLFPPSGEHCRDVLPLTDRDRAAMANSIYDMIKKPPFTNQFGVDRRTETLGKAVAEMKLRARATLEHAEQVYRGVMAQRPDDLVVRTKLAEILVERGKLIEATLEWRALLERVPRVPAWLTELGFAEAGRGEMESAVGALRQVIELEPYSADARINLGTVLERMDDVEGAERQYGKAREIDPGSLTALFNLGSLQVQAGDLERAAGYYREALEIDPESPDAHFRLGGLLDSQERFDDAVTEYSRAVELDPDMAPAWNNIGYIREREGRVAEAVNDYQRAIELDPELSIAYFNLADIGFANGDVERAVELYRMGLNFEPGHVAARYNLAGGLTVLERSAEAVEQFRVVLQLAPDNPEALHNLAWILATSADAAIGNPAEAVRLAERASSLTGDEIPEILETLAVAYASNGQAARASETAMRALEIARRHGNDALVQALETRLRSHGALKSAG